MNSSNKCAQCGLVNHASDAACRRCDALLGKTFSQPLLTKNKEAKGSRSSIYLVLLPFLLLGLGFWYWSSEIKKSADDAMHVDKDEWHGRGLADRSISNTNAQPASQPGLKTLMSNVNAEDFRKQQEQYEKFRRGDGINPGLSNTNQSRPAAQPKPQASETLPPNPFSSTQGR